MKNPRRLHSKCFGQVSLHPAWKVHCHFVDPSNDIGKLKDGVYRNLSRAKNEEAYLIIAIHNSTNVITWKTRMKIIGLFSTETQVCSTKTVEKFSWRHRSCSLIKPQLQDLVDLDITRQRRHRDNGQHFKKIIRELVIWDQDHFSDTVNTVLDGHSLTNSLLF